ncbi:MAG: hypothetical protein DRJ63_03045 [Thermoprotei archaeon]|nr:MAG: hypothetical protein DRJ63_03045 [Thermoprotei archaeon]
MTTAPALPLEAAARLHGHKGPWLVLGYRAGARACEVLDPSDEFTLYCIVKTPLKTPYTCAIDGIQASTRCTLGKLSIKIEESTLEKIAYIFVDKRTGRRLELRLKPGVAKWIEEVDRKDMRKAVKIAEETPLQELFEEKLYD